MGNHEAQFENGRFKNPFAEWEDKTFLNVFRWQWSRRGIPGGGYLSYNRRPTAKDWAAAFPPVAVDAAALASPPPDAVQATWIGHSTVLVQMEGVTFLTDPVFASRCSPLSFVGPKRVTPPALSVAELPHVDAVVLSHNHYDHLCRGTVLQLHARFGDKLQWYVPLGMATWFHGAGVRSVTELNWWQAVQHCGVRVTFTPAMHWSMRTGPWDRKASLWGGFAITGERCRFWFAGDTGYCSGLFTEIGARLGPFDLAAVPTGAYAPRDFMRAQHVDPKDAVQVHREVRSLRSMAIHLATFPLTDEPMDEPVTLLEQEAALAGLAEDEFITLRHGATIATAGGRDVAPPSRLRVPPTPVAP
jgi:N-acyl-phosphatidylethanolamine-hydrolysing phospholipase D